MTRINRTVQVVESRIANPYLGPQRHIDNQVYQVAAKRIRGDTTGIIAPGATGNITGLKGIDGLAYETDPLTVRNKITGFAIPNGSTVLAQWVHEDQEWQVIEIAGEGGPTTPEPVAYGAMQLNTETTLSGSLEQALQVPFVTTPFAAVDVTVDTTNNRLVINTAGLYCVSFTGYLRPQTGSDGINTIIETAIRADALPITVTKTSLAIVNGSTKSDGICLSTMWPLTANTQITAYCTLALGTSFFIGHTQLSVARISGI